MNIKIRLLNGAALDARFIEIPTGIDPLVSRFFFSTYGIGADLYFHDHVTDSETMRSLTDLSRIKGGVIYDIVEPPPPPELPPVPSSAVAMILASIADSKAFQDTIKPRAPRRLGITPYLSRNQK